jgi:hypothetical protein
MAAAGRKHSAKIRRDTLRAFLAPETTRWQYVHGVTDEARVSPDGIALDNFYLARPGMDEVQLDLLGDYRSNVALYQTSRTTSAPTSHGSSRSRRGIEFRATHDFVPITAAFAL